MINSLYRVLMINSESFLKVITIKNRIILNFYKTINIKNTTRLKIMAFTITDALITIIYKE